MSDTQGKKFSKLEWLKRTNGHKFTGAEFRVLIAIYNHSGSDGTNSRPSVETITQHTTYSEAQVKRALRGLRDRGWIRQVSKGSGYGQRASVYELVPDAPLRLTDEPKEGSASSEAEEPIGLTSDTHIGITGETPIDQGTDPKRSVPSNRSNKGVGDRPDQEIRPDERTGHVPGVGGPEAEPTKPVGGLSVSASEEPASSRFRWEVRPDAPADIVNTDEYGNEDLYSSENWMNRAMRFILEKCQGLNREDTSYALWPDFGTGFEDELTDGGYIGQRLQLIEE